MADISFNIARKELKIAQIAQLYQLFRLLHLIHIYGHGFYELSRMVMRKNVNSDVSKDSPIEKLSIKFMANGKREFVTRVHTIFYLYELFWAVFTCSFSILRNSQPESDVCRLPYTWNLNSPLRARDRGAEISPKEPY